MRGKRAPASDFRYIVGVLALLRNALLALVAAALEPRQSLPKLYEDCAHPPRLALHLIRPS